MGYSQWGRLANTTLNNSITNPTIKNLAIDTEWLNIEPPIKATGLVAYAGSVADSTSIYGESVLLTTDATAISIRLTAYTGTLINATIVSGFRYNILCY